jgi:hypothetical protein
MATTLANQALVRALRKRWRWTGSEWVQALDRSR